MREVIDYRWGYGCVKVNIDLFISVYCVFVIR